MTTVSRIAEGTDNDTFAKAAQPRQFIVTLYGLYSRHDGGWLSVASIVDLLGELDIDGAAVRSSISRLKRRGIVTAQRRGGAAGYALSPTGLAILEEGDQRIFHREPATLADGWILAVFSVPESERHKRHLIRSQLTRLGFGTVAPGVWIAPAHLRQAAEDTLRRRDLDQYAEVFRGEHLAFGDMAAKVREWWDFDELEALYSAFLAEHEPAHARWRRRRTDDERQAFADHMRLLTDWRRLPYLDPGLPAELLPPRWVGARAAGLFFDLQDRLREPAQAYASAVLAAR